jgi:ribosome-binding protein aMBF1 (putative translation factor)
LPLNRPPKTPSGAASVAAGAPEEEQEMPKSSSVDQIVGGRVRLRRIQRGMKRAALAASLGILETQLQACEAGRERVGAELLYQICRQLKVGAQFFFESWIADPAIEPQSSTRELGKVADRT